MKKFIALMLALIMAFALCACGGGSSAPAAVEPEPADAAPAEDAPAEEVPAEAAPAEEPAADTASGEPAGSEEAGPAADLSGEDYYKWTMSTAQNDGTWYAVLMEDFAAEIEARTDGHITFDIHHGNTLGAPEDIYNGMITGTIDVVNLGMSQAGSFPVSDITQIPFFCNDPYEALAVLEALYDAGYLTEYTDNGFQLLAFHPTDTQMISLVDKKVESIADFQGLKIRVNSGSIIKAIEAFGATATSIETREVAMALQNGNVDGAVSSPAAMTVFGFDEACQYLYEVPLAIGGNYICVSDISWNALSPTLQAIVKEVAEELEPRYMEENVAAMNESISVFREPYEPTEEALAEMQDATAFIREEWASNLTAQGYDGEAIMALAQQTLADYRAGNGTEAPASGESSGEPS